MSGGLVGKVSVKVSPDTKEFRKKLREQLTAIEAKENKNPLKIQITPVFDDTKIAAEAKKVSAKAKAALGDGIKLKVNLDDASDIDRGIAAIKAKLVDLGRTHEIDLSVNQAGLQKQLDNLTKKRFIDLGVDLAKSSVPDLEAALATVRKELEKLNAVELKVKLNESSLKAMEKKLAAAIAKRKTFDIHVDLKNEDSITKAISAINAELEKMKPLNLHIGFNQKDLLKEKAKLEAALKVQADVKLAFEQAQAKALMARVQAQLRNINFAPGVDEAKLAATRAEIEASLIKIEEIKSTITVDMDQVSKRKAELEIEALRRRIDKLQVDLKPEVDKKDEAKASAILKFLARARKVSIKPVLDSKAVKGVEGVLTRLSGFRLVEKKLEFGAELVKDFDELGPEVAMVAVQMGSFALAGASALAAVGAISGALGSIALATPGILGGFAVGLGAMFIALKSFKKEIPEFKTLWAQMKATIVDNFWAQAAKNMHSFVDTLMPQFTKALAGTSAALGKWTAAFAGAFKTAFNGKLNTMFDPLNQSIAVFSKAAQPIANIFLTLGQAGASTLPRIAQLFLDLANRFSAFLDVAKGNGALQHWMDTAVSSLTSLIEIAVQLGRVLGGVFKALDASTKGNLFGGLVSSLTKIADFINGAQFQGALQATFAGLFDGIHQIITIAGPALQNFFVTLGQLLGQVLPLVGQILGTLLRDVANALANPALSGAIVTLFQTLVGVANALTPVWGILSDALVAIAPVLNQTLGLFGQITAAMSKSLMPILNAIIPPIQSLITILGGALLQVMEAMEPTIIRVVQAFADFLNTGVIPALTTMISALVPVMEKVAPVIGDALVKAFQAITPLVLVLGDAFAKLVPVLMNSLVPILPKIVDAFVALVQAILPFIPVLVNELVPLLPKVADAFVQILVAVIPLIQPLTDLFMSILLPLLPVVAQIIQQVADAFTAMSPAIKDMIDKLHALWDLLSPVLIPVLKILATILIDTVKLAIDGVINVVKGLYDVFNGIISFFKDLFTGQWSKLWGDVLQILKGAFELIVGAIELFISVGILKPFKLGWDFIKLFFSKEGFLKILGELLDFLGGIGKSIGHFFEDLAVKAAGMLGKIWRAIGDALDNVGGFFRDLPGKILNFLGNVGKTLLNVGWDLIRGLWNGLTAAGGWLFKQIGVFFGNLLPGWIKKLLGINSPSKVTAEMGKFLTLGLGVGITDPKSMNSVKGSVTDLATHVSNSFQSAVSLKESGVTVMDSFRDGLESRYDLINKSVKAFGSDVTDGLATALKVGDGKLTRQLHVTADGAMAGGTNETKVFNYYAAPGSSLSAEEDLFTAANRSRMAW